MARAPTLPTTGGWILLADLDTNAYHALRYSEIALWSREKFTGTERKHIGGKARTVKELQDEHLHCMQELLGLVCLAIEADVPILGVISSEYGLSGLCAPADGDEPLDMEELNTLVVSLYNFISQTPGEGFISPGWFDWIQRYDALAPPIKDGLAREGEDVAAAAAGAGGRGDPRFWDDDSDSSSNASSSSPSTSSSSST